MKNEIVRHHFPVIDSTNTWAKDHVAQFDRSKVVVITADEQTAGRGQWNRKWVSFPNQNICATFCFFLEQPLENPAVLAQISGVAVALFLEELGFKPKLKYPNDLFLQGKKVAGILCETVSDDKGRWAIIGIGINVNTSAEDLKVIDQPATSLSIEKPGAYDREELTLLLQTELISTFRRWLKEGDADLLREYQARLRFPE